MLDSDDFFVPMNPGEKKLHYYVDKWCKESASCAFSWIEYYPDLGLKVVMWQMYVLLAD